MFNLWGLNQDCDKSSWAKHKGETSKRKQRKKKRNKSLRKGLDFIVLIRWRTNFFCEHKPYLRQIERQRLKHSAKECGEVVSQEDNPLSQKGDSAHNGHAKSCAETYHQGPDAYLSRSSKGPLVFLGEIEVA